MGKKQIPGSQDNGTGMLPPDALLRHWTGPDGPLPPGAPWTALDGGRTNAVWLVAAADGPVVVKLYRRGAATPLFANEPRAEAAALLALAGTGLAPQLVKTARTPVGPSIVYAHVEGHSWQTGDGTGPVARALARLHHRSAPKQLPRAPRSVDALRQQTRRILADLGTAGTALAAQEPLVGSDLDTGAACFLHGDATAGNALVSGGAITFIDWQCPALGDPVLDIAVFLSPAMQLVSGNRPLTSAEEASFFTAYGDDGVARRYRALTPLLHWRMAAYCLWRAARGDAGYGEAAALEAACLRAAR